MGTVDKVTISVDRELLRRVEALRKNTGESRSALVSRALSRLIEEQEQRDRIAEYIKTYQEHPEEQVDVDRARSLAKASLANLPWDES